MCTDVTTQGYMFLKAFGEPEETFGEIEIGDRVSVISEDFRGNDYYAVMPRSLEDLFNISVTQGYIRSVSPHRWKITAHGVEKRNTLAHTPGVPVLTPRSNLVY